MRLGLPVHVRSEGLVSAARRRRSSLYGDAIALRLRAFRRTDVDVRHVEGWMRVAHSTLDALSTSEFTHEVRLAIDCIDAAGKERSEEIASSYGL